MVNQLTNWLTVYRLTVLGGRKLEWKNEAPGAIITQIFTEERPRSLNESCRSVSSTDSPRKKAGQSQGQREHGRPREIIRIVYEKSC